VIVHSERMAWIPGCVPIGMILRMALFALRVQRWLEMTNWVPWTPTSHRCWRCVPDPGLPQPIGAPGESSDGILAATFSRGSNQRADLTFIPRRVASERRGGGSA